MTTLQRATSDLVIANRILAHHGVFDEYGHVSVRHPDAPDRFLLARDCAAAFVEPGDILAFTLDGAPASEDNRPLCAERFLHAAIYAARPEVNAVLCAGSEDVLPFSITPTPLCAVLGTVGDMGTHVPVWDIADKFGEDTDLGGVGHGTRPRSGAASRRQSRRPAPRHRLRRHRPHAQRRGEDLGLHPEERALARAVAGVRDRSGRSRRARSTRASRSIPNRTPCAAAGNTGRAKPAANAGFSRTAYPLVPMTREVQLEHDGGAPVTR